METPEKLGLKHKYTSVDISHQPIIQSGGTYSLKPSADSDDSPLSPDIVLCSVGVCYDNYCVGLARTFLINPSLFQECAYNALAEVELEVIRSLVPGATLGDVYDRALAMLNQKEPSLIPYFSKECGAGIGLEFRESALRIRSGNPAQVQAGMCFHVRLGVENVPNTRKKEEEANTNDLTTFSILLSDTIIVNEKTGDSMFGGTSSNFTATPFSTEWSNVSYEVHDEEEEENEDDEEGARSQGRAGKHDWENEDEEDEDDEEDGLNGEGRRKRDDMATALAIASASSGRRVTRGMVRAEKLAEQMEMEESRLSQRNKHQRQLFEELVKRKEKHEAGTQAAEEEVIEAEDIEVFPTPAHYPAELRRDQIYADTENEVLFVPIYGTPVPFSVHTIKSVSLNDEDNYGIFRVNFHTPQGRSAKDVDATMAKALDQYPAATYIKSLSFRSRDQTNMNVQLKRIKNMMKMRRQKDKYTADTANIVEQGQLELLRNGRPPFLNNVDMRPSVNNKPGRLEAHVNGFRFTPTRGECTDILYSNIRHAIYQPCINTRFVILHFHLRNPIMVGRKKCKDIQFYTEVIEASHNLKGTTTNAYDPEEIEAEQREREAMRQLNKAFESFTQKCDKVEFDMPYRRSAFNGRPAKEMVTLYPCRDCLVNVLEQPCFVITLDEIEHVHFQRVSFSTSTIDMIVIFKDYTRPVVEIDAVKTSDLDKVKEWLDSINIVCEMMIMIDSQ